MHLFIINPEKLIEKSHLTALVVWKLPHWTHYLFIYLFILLSICKDKHVCLKSMSVHDCQCVQGAYGSSHWCSESSSHCQRGGSPCGTGTALSLHQLHGEWNLRIETGNRLHRPPPWPLTRAIKLNSPLGFFDCLCLPVSLPLASLSRWVWKITSICFCVWCLEQASARFRS